MPYIEPVSDEEATGYVAATYRAAKERAGQVAHIIRIMSRDGRSQTASMQFYVALMKTPNALSAAQKEMLATVVSNANDCYY